MVKNDAFGQARIYTKKLQGYHGSLTFELQHISFLNFSEEWSPLHALSSHIIPTSLPGHFDGVFVDSASMINLVLQGWKLSGTAFYKPYTTVMSKHVMRSSYQGAPQAVKESNSDQHHLWVHVLLASYIAYLAKAIKTDQF